MSLMSRLMGRRARVKADLLELERFRVKLSEYQRWLSEFPDVSLVLENFAAEVAGSVSLCASFPPGPEGPWDVQGLRETLRRTRAAR